MVWTIILLGAFVDSLFNFLIYLVLGLKGQPAEAANISDTHIDRILRDHIFTHLNNSKVN